MTQKKKKIMTCMLSLCLVFTLYFIFGNSMDSREVSAEKSGLVQEVVNMAIEALGSEEAFTEHAIRKMAHFLEFFALGIELTAMCMIWKQPLVWAAFSGLLAALTDETIQIFSKRGSSAADVWLDFSGVVVGLLLLWGCTYIHRRNKDEVMEI